MQIFTQIYFFKLLSFLQMRQMSFVRLSDVFKLNSIDKTLHCEVNCLNKRHTILFFLQNHLYWQEGAGSGVWDVWMIQVLLSLVWVTRRRSYIQHCRRFCRSSCSLKIIAWTQQKFHSVFVCAKSRLTHSNFLCLHNPIVHQFSDCNFLSSCSALKQPLIPKKAGPLCVTSQRANLKSRACKRRKGWDVFAQCGIFEQQIEGLFWIEILTLKLFRDAILPLWWIAVFGWSLCTRHGNQTGALQKPQQS